MRAMQLEERDEQEGDAPMRSNRPATRDEERFRKLGLVEFTCGHFRPHSMPFNAEGGTYTASVAAAGVRPMDVLVCGERVARDVDAKLKSLARQGPNAIENFMKVRRRLIELGSRICLGAPSQRFANFFDGGGFVLYAAPKDSISRWFEIAAANSGPLMVLAAQVLEPLLESPPADTASPHGLRLVTGVAPGGALVVAGMTIHEGRETVVDGPLPPRIVQTTTVLVRRLDAGLDAAAA